MEMVTEKRALRVDGIELQLVFNSDKLVAIELPKKVPADLGVSTFKKIVREISRYKTSLDDATPFVREVWEAMRKIPAGKTMTYSELAAAVGRPDAVRAVGSAVGKNQLLILLPCHRVVGKNNLGGFRAGLDWKRKLLELESAL